MRHIVFRCILLSILAAGCVDLCEPEGSYNLTFTWKEGTCGFTGTEELFFTLAIIRGQVFFAGFHVDFLPGQQVTNACDDRTLLFDDTIAGERFRTTLVMDEDEDDGKITGDGVRERLDAPSCSQNFTITGTKDF